MTILNDTVLENNKYLKINYDGDDLSSDADLILIIESTCKHSLYRLWNIV